MSNIPLTLALGKTLAQYNHQFNNRTDLLAKINQAFPPDQLKGHKPACQRRPCTHPGYHRSYTRSRIIDSEGVCHQANLARVKGSGGAQTWTVQPSILIPRKHYAAYTLQNSLEQVLSLEMTCRATVSHHHQLSSTGHPNPNQFVSPYTPWNWLKWLGCFPWPLVRLACGLTPPQQVVEDEKFVRQNPLQTYLLGLVAHPTDLLWWLDYQWQTDQTAIQNSLQNFLDELWLATGLLHRFKGPTTAGCKAAFAALNQATGPGECLLQPYLKFKQELYHWAKLTKTPLGAINLPCSGSIQKYHWAKLTKTPLGGLKQLSQLFGRVLFATDQTAFEAGLAELESRPECKHPLLAARLASLKPKKAGLLAHFEDEHLALSSNALDRRFGRLERKVSSMPQFRPEQSAYWTITAWGIVQDLGYYGATARPAGQGRVEVAGVDLEGLSWLQFIMLKIARLHWLKDPLADAVAQT